jgi:hypothetical protein
MKKIVLLSAAIASALTLAGCGGTREENAVGGALVGGAAGALIGGAATGRAGGALVGGVVGAAAGAAIGGSQPARECVRVRYDAYGNAVCTRYVVR